MQRLLCAGLLCMLISLSCGTITQAPRDTVYHSGTDTNGYVTCIVSTPGTTGVFWYVTSANENGLVYTTDIGIFNGREDKFYVDADAGTTGNYTLMIKNLDRGDTGGYSCQYGQTTALSARVTIAEPPGKPVLTVPTALAENTDATFVCTSEGGFPSPNITWALGSTVLPPSDYTTTVSTDGNRVTSRLTVALTNQHHNKELLCEAENILSSDTMSQTLNVQFSPRVQVTPQNLVVLRDSRFNLTCSESSNPARTSLVWKIGNNEIASQVAVHTVEGGISEDTTYQCDVRNSRGLGEGSSLVTVHYSPEVTISQGGSTTIRENTDLILNCAVDAKPAASVKWYRGDEFLRASPELVIRSATRQNRGTYRCVAKNTPSPTGAPAEEKTQSATIQVDVQYAAQVPLISVSPISSSEEYRAGQRIALSCTTPTDRGNPEREIKWYRDDSVNPIHSGEDFVIETPQVEDSGSYKCQAENSIDQVPSNTEAVTIIDVPELVIADDRREVSISEGTPDIDLECTYRGLPTPQIIWYKDDEKINDDGTMYTIREQNDSEDNSKYEKVTSTLYFEGSERNQLMVSDFALYRCVASNSAGESVRNFQRQVNILFSPQLDGHGKVATDIGEEVVIPCTVLSFPPATEITFKRNGEVITNSDQYQLSNIESNVDGMSYKQRRNLVILSATNSDYGNYECEATNSEDTASATLTLMRTTIPDAPSDVEVSTVEWDTAVLTWSPGFDGGKQQRFQIVYTAAGTSQTAETIELSFSLRGLNPDTDYIVKVYGENVLGTSQSFAQMSFVTEDLIIPTPTFVQNEAENRLEIKYNYTDYCVKVQGMNEAGTLEDLTQCQISPGPFPVSDQKYSQYRALACVPGRDDVCAASPMITVNFDGGEEGLDKMVIIAIVVAVVVVALVVSAVAAIFVMRSRRRRLNKADNSPKTGHINHMMSPKGVPGEVHYSNSGYQVNSDLELEDEADGLPYGEFRNNRVESPVSASAPFQNLDYVYASVQKKPSEQNKLNEHAVNAYNLQNADRMNIQDPSSVSDNSEADHYGGPPSPYRGPDRDLSFLGDGALAFHRYPSMSESNYSSPEGKQLKKVVYEVIV